MILFMRKEHGNVERIDTYRHALDARHMNVIALAKGQLPQQGGM